MNLLARARYRVRQFWHTLFHPGKPLEAALLAPYLTPAQIALFQRMHPSEQRHAFGLLQTLQTEGLHHPDLLAAALLHDIGKVLAPLSLAERVIIVLGQRFTPRLAARLADNRLQGFSRPFVVAARHADWGAALAAQAGASAHTCAWIRAHHAAPSGDDPLLAALQRADRAG